MEGWTAELAVGLWLVVPAMGFEPTQVDPIRFETLRLNHSATPPASSHSIYNDVYCVLSFPLVSVVSIDNDVTCIFCILLFLRINHQALILQSRISLPCIRLSTLGKIQELKVKVLWCCVPAIIIYLIVLDSELQSRMIVEGPLTHRVRHEECFWSLVPGECIQIHLEKTKELYWTALLKGEPEIDKTKLDTTRDINEFDQQTQADFQKVMYDHHQKLQGKPTSEEQVSNRFQLTC